MAVRAKFKVESRTETTDGYKVVLKPVTGGSPENESFFKYTPYGSIEIGTINAAAGAQLVPGKSYYVDFTEAA